MRRILPLLALLLSFAFAVPAHAEMTSEEVNNLIRDYIRNNPKDIMDSVEKYSKDQQVQSDTRVAETIEKSHDWLLKNSDHAEAGNPKGDVTIVEFFDYNCGYCKQSMPDLMTLLDQDKKLRLVFVEIPILGPSSITAAKWALAAKKQGLYLPFHIALMRHKGPINDEVLADYATKAGLNVDKIKQDITDKSMDTILDNNTKMAQGLTIQGTPAFVMGNELVRGYVGLDAMKESIESVRAVNNLKK